MVRKFRNGWNTTFFSDGKRGIQSRMAARVKPQSIYNVNDQLWESIGQGLMESGPSTAAL